MSLTTIIYGLGSLPALLLALLTRERDTVDDALDVDTRAHLRAHLRALRREERRDTVPTRTLLVLATLTPEDEAGCERTLNAFRAMLARERSA